MLYAGPITGPRTAAFGALVFHVIFFVFHELCHIGRLYIFSNMLLSLLKTLCNTKCVVVICELIILLLSKGHAIRGIFQKQVANQLIKQLKTPISRYYCRIDLYVLPYMLCIFSLQSRATCR